MAVIEDDFVAVANLADNRAVLIDIDLIEAEFPHFFTNALPNFFNITIHARNCHNIAEKFQNRIVGFSYTAIQLRYLFLHLLRFSLYKAFFVSQYYPVRQKLERASLLALRCIS